MNKKSLFSALCLLGAFLLWTMAVSFVDVRPVGPGGSSVGLATINQLFHQFTGVHFSLYTITDWLSLIPLATGLGFGMLGFSQWIRRKKLWHVDRSLIALGAFYLLVLGAYAFFEIHPVNYRPVWIEGMLEASYPSSTTLLVLCMMPTAGMQLRARIRKPAVRRWLLAVNTAFIAFMLIARLLSGVHWLTDILGGILLSGGLTRLYQAFSGLPMHSCTGTQNTDGTQKQDQRRQKHDPTGKEQASDEHGDRERQQDHRKDLCQTPGNFDCELQYLPAQPQKDDDNQ